MRTIFILALVAIFFFKSIKSRSAALYTYWWFGIFRPHEWVWGSIMTSLKLPLIAAFLLIVPSVFQKKIPGLKHPIAILMAMLFFFEMVASVLNGCGGDGYIIRTKNLTDLAILIFTVLLSVELIKDRKTLFLLISVIAFSIAFHSGKGGLVAMASGANNYGANNLSGLFSGSNAYALGSAMLMFFMIFTFQFAKKSWADSGGVLTPWAKLNTILKYLMLLLIFGSIYNVMSLQSRGSFFAMSIGLLLWILLHEARVKLLLALVVTLTIGLAIIPLPEGYTERIQSVFADEDDLDKSAASRPHFWMTAVDIAKDHPLGVGPGCYPVYYNKYDRSNGEFGRYRSVHSSHFQVLSDAGFLGALLWAMLFIVAYRRLWGLRKAAKERIEEDEGRFYFYLANGLMGSITVFLIGGSFYEYAYNEIIWLVWAMVIVVEKLFYETYPKSTMFNMARSD